METLAACQVVRIAGRQTTENHLDGAHLCKSIRILNGKVSVCEPGPASANITTAPRICYSERSRVGATIRPETTPLPSFCTSTALHSQVYIQISWALPLLVQAQSKDTSVAAAASLVRCLAARPVDEQFLGSRQAPGPFRLHRAVAGLRRQTRWQQEAGPAGGRCRRGARRRGCSWMRIHSCFGGLVRP